MPTGSRISFTELCETVRVLPRKHAQKAIAIDGGGGAGKTTFANHLKRAFGLAEIIAVDDFFKGPMEMLDESGQHAVNPIFDWDRFNEQVVAPITEGREISYQKYDWELHALDGRFLTLPSDALIIIEGAYSTQERFRELYDYTFWIETEEGERLERILARDGAGSRSLWEEKLFPAERRYRRRGVPSRKVRMVVDGLESDYESGYVVALGSS